jgi:hypothetical protein
MFWKKQVDRWPRVGVWKMNSSWPMGGTCVEITVKHEPGMTAAMEPQINMSSLWPYKTIILGWLNSFNNSKETFDPPPMFNNRLGLGRSVRQVPGIIDAFRLIFDSAICIWLKVSIHSALLYNYGTGRRSAAA